MAQPGTAIIAAGMGVLMLTPAVTQWLEGRGLDIELCAKLGIDATTRAGGEAVVVPFVRGGETVNRKYRKLSPGQNEAAWSQDSGGEQILWNEDILRDESLTSQPVIITEGEWDAIAAIQCGFQRTVSVPNGAPSASLGTEGGVKYRYLDDTTLQRLRKSPCVVLAADQDEPGAALMQDLAIRIGTHKCKFLRYPKGCKDLNDALKRYGQKGVVETLNRAKWFDVPGLKTWDDMPDRPRVQAFNHGIEGLDQLCRIRPGDLSVIAGYANFGKSALALNIACNMNRKYDWKVLLGSLEDEKPDLEMKLMTVHTGMLMRDIPEVMKTEAREWIRQSFVFMQFDPDDGNGDLAAVLDIMAAAVTRHDVKLIVLDPWNEIEHDRPPGMSLTEYVGKALRMIRRFARKYMVHVMIVAHPAKQQKLKDGSLPELSLYDVSDSAHFANKSDLGIIVGRNEDGTSTISVRKVKYQPQMGEVGEVTLRFIRERGEFVKAEESA